jgi:hypothetical protein
MSGETRVSGLRICVSGGGKELTTSSAHCGLRPCGRERPFGKPLAAHFFCTSGRGKSFSFALFSPHAEG